ncbi:uncharacterized protein LOC115456303 [Manduca sexta]|uniref:uncharacterized protein LOC115456303 n=1 Tax=Manduca sexta TaxID=7130 RepID=UPI00188E8B81|nr:uncharacterized protein LOC115456303 [Manduca sexta]
MQSKGKYTNCLGRHSDLPENNMWDLDTYKQYLNRIGKIKVWDNIIYPGMMKSIIGTMLSCQDSLPVCKNRFELYGCDFILDKEYKPWLIEINSCPDLNHTTHVTARICPAVVCDIIKVVIDFAADPNSSTGKFECIYRQPMTIPRYGGAADLSVRGYSLPLEYFYRGNIELTEIYDNADIDKEYDVKTILNKLKEHYDIDIMVEPDEDFDDTNKKEKETYVDNTKSELELTVAATVITEQLEELLDRITSDPSCSSKSNVKRETSSSHSIKRKKSSLQSVKSVTDIKSLLKKSYNRFASIEAINVGNQQLFKFSKLDDGPNGKGSCAEINPVEKSIRDLTTIIKMEKIDKKCKKQNTKCKSIDNMLKATSKIISFIHDKEKEY